MSSICCFSLVIPKLDFSPRPQLEPPDSILQDKEERTTVVRLYCTKATQKNISPEKYHGCNLYNSNQKFIYDISPEMEPTRAPPSKVEIGPFCIDLPKLNPF